MIRWLDRRAVLAPALLLLVACAAPVDPEGVRPLGQWHPVPLPGKAATEYRATQKDGRAAVGARSARSASMLRKRVDVSAERVGEISFSWWVEGLVAEKSVADIDREDAPARVLFGFGGDVSKLPARTRMLFDLAQALTGEPPPYATLMYVWDANAPVGSVIVNPRSDRIRKIVLDSGPGKLRQWRDHRRNLAADFRLAFGEEPGPLLSIGLMTDSDNTATSAQAWYGDVTLH